MTLDSLLQYDAVDVVRTFGKKSILTNSNNNFTLFVPSQQEIDVEWNSSNDFIYSVSVDIESRGLKQVIDSLPLLWKTKFGLALGLTLEDVQELNGQPFMLTKSDKIIWVSDWAGGNLSLDRAEVNFALTSSLATEIPMYIASDELIKNKVALQVSKIILRKSELTMDPLVDEDESDANSMELTEETLLSARENFKNTVLNLPKFSLPYNFEDIMNSEGVEINCYAFPTDEFCNRYPAADMNKLYTIPDGTPDFYVLFWSGNRFAYIADIPKLFLTTFDKNWKPISTVDLHIWLASWSFEQSDCKESNPQYSTVLNTDLSFLLTYKSEYSCVGEDKVSTKEAKISGQINPDGTITVNREGLD